MTFWDAEMTMNCCIDRFGRRLLAVGALFFVAMMLPAKSASLPDDRVAAAKPAPAVPPASTVLVTGLSSLVELPSTLGGLLPESMASESPVCVRFWIRNTGPAALQLRLTSSGIGGARLLELRGKGRDEPSCPREPGTASTLLVLANVVDQERPILLILPASAFPENADGAKGKLLVLQAGLPASEVPIALKRSDFSPVVKALIWFWSVFLSALIAAGFSLFLYRANKRVDAASSAKETLDRLRLDEDGTLKKFVDLYPNLVACADSASYRKEMEDALGASRILYALTPDARERLMAAVRTGDRAKAARELARVFPEHQAIFKSGT